MPSRCSPWIQRSTSSFHAPDDNHSRYSRRGSSAFSVQTCNVATDFNKHALPVQVNHLISCTDPLTGSVMEESMSVVEDFITPEEEKSLINEVEPHLSRLRYEFDHWDDVCTYVHVHYFLSNV